MLFPDVLLSLALFDLKYTIFNLKAIEPTILFTLIYFPNFQTKNLFAVDLLLSLC